MVDKEPWWDTEKTLEQEGCMGCTSQIPQLHMSLQVTLKLAYLGQKYLSGICDQETLDNI